MLCSQGELYLLLIRC